MAKKRFCGVLGVVLFATVYIIIAEFENFKNFAIFRKEVEELQLSKFSGLSNIEEREKRMFNLNETCNLSKNFSTTLGRLNPIQRKSFLRHVFVSEKYKFLYCYIPKVSCSNWKRVLMALHGIQDPNNKKVAQSVPQGLRVLSNYNNEKIESMLQNYYKFMIVRNPLERMVSAYRDKFENHQIEIYNKKTPKQIKTKYRGAGNENKGPEVITPEEFVRYVIDQRKDEAMDEHWQPMYSLCQPCLVKYNSIGSLDHMIVDSEDILEEIGVPEKIHFPGREQNYAKPTSKNITISFYSQVNETYIQQFLQKYASDFNLFTFPFPDLKFFRLPDIL